MNLTRHRFKQSALAIIAGAFAAVLAPSEQITPSAWAAKNVKVADGPYAGQFFKPELTPYLIEPLDFFADECPDNKAVIRKSKQTGFTTLAIVASGYTFDIEPCDLFLIEPTDSSLSDFVSLKLQPTIEGSPALRKKVSAQVSRSGKGSTAYVKRFAGGTMLMGIATSSADLRGKTRKKIIRDEASEYPRDLSGQGSPHDMITGSYETFLATGDFKDLWISTPTNLGACWIDEEFEKGDQRYWHVPCPGCAEEFVLGLNCFVYANKFPFCAHFVAPCCGVPVEGHEKNDLVCKGRWIATAPAPGKFRSYHFDAFSSPFVPLDVIAQRIVDAGTDSAKLKTLYNLTYGLPYEIKADVPDHAELLKRVEPDLKRGHVPAKGLLLTAFADVQMRGIWLEIVATAPNRETWSVDALYIDGDTGSVDGAVFDRLKHETIDRQFPDAFGRDRALDALAIDSGYRSHVVYSWVRRNQRVHPDSGHDVILATKGLEGWGRAAIGQPVLVDIALGGTRIKQGCKVWGLGTWPLKGAVYTDLKQELPAAPEAPLAPDGYCHFGSWNDEVYFMQLTSEALEDVTYRGRKTGSRWVRHRQNHFLDCRVGNKALAEYLGLSSTTPEQWSALARKRGLPDELSKVDLFTYRGAASVHDPAQAEQVIVARKEAERQAKDQAPRVSWITPPRRGGWLKR